MIHVIAECLYHITSLSLVLPLNPTPVPPLATTFLLCSYEFDIFKDFTNKLYHEAVLFLLSLLYFIWYNAFQFYPYCCKWQVSLLSPGWIIHRSLIIFIHSSVDVHWCCCPILDMLIRFKGLISVINQVSRYILTAKLEKNANKYFYIENLTH